MDPNTEQTNTVDGGQGLSETDTSGESELNSLLDEFEKGAAPKTETPPVQPDTKVIRPDLSKLDPVIKYAEAAMQRDQKEAFERDVDAAVEKIASNDALKGFPKEFVRKMTIAHAFDDKSFDSAFQNRSDSPNEWEAAIDKAGSLFAEQVKGLSVAPEEKAPAEEQVGRDDIEAAKATVDGVQDDNAQADEGPSVVERANMSDTEWRNYLAERELRTG